MEETLAKSFYEASIIYILKIKKDKEKIEL
jgi:hypothetical protein